MLYSYIAFFNNLIFDLFKTILKLNDFFEATPQKVVLICKRDVLSDTTALNSGWKGGCITEAAKLIEGWTTIPVMCQYHSIECLCKHQLLELSSEVFGPIPKMNDEESSTHESYRTIGYNMKYLYKYFQELYRRASARRFMPTLGACAQRQYSFENDCLGQ